MAFKRKFVPPALAVGDRVAVTKANGTSRFGRILAKLEKHAVIRFDGGEVGTKPLNCLSFRPTPRQIAQLCEMFQKGWTPLDEKHRRGLMADFDEGYRFPSYGGSPDGPMEVRDRSAS